MILFTQSSKMSKSNLWRWKPGESLSWLCQEGVLLGGGLLGAGHSYLFAQLLILGCIYFVESHPAARSLMIYSLFCVLVTHQRKIYFKKVLPCQVRFRTISPATLLGLGALWAGGHCLHLSPSEPVPGRRNHFFLLILSSALAWSYCTYANEAMSAIEANSAIYSWSLATLITAAADFRKPKHTHARAHTHMHTHIRTQARTCTHTTQSIFSSPGYKFPIPLQSGPSHATLIVCYITFIKK